MGGLTAFDRILGKPAEKPAEESRPEPDEALPPVNP
jgi:hypothetical protein